MSGTESILVRMQQAMQGLRDATRQANTEADRLRQNFAAIDAAARDAIANGFTGRGNFRNYLPQGSDDFTALQRQQARDHAVSILNQQSPQSSHHNIGATVASAVRNEAGQFFRATLAAAGAASVTAFAFRGADRAVDLNVETDKLMRMSRGLAGGFDSLLDSMKSTADSIHMPAEEAAKLAVSLAKLGGTVDLNTMAAQAKASRAFGLDNATLPTWMADMKWRGAGAPSDLLATFATTVARTGMGGKSEELLHSFKEYADRTEKVLLHTADLGGFAVSMSALGSITDAGGNPLPGLRGAAGAALLKQIDDGFRQSGAGEAGEVARGRFFASRGVTNPYEQKFRAEEPISANPQMLEDYFKFTKQLIGGDDPYRWYDGIANDIGISRHAAKNIMDFQARGGDLGAFGGWVKQTTGKGLTETPEAAFADLSQIWNLSDKFNQKKFGEADVGSMLGLLTRYKVDADANGGMEESNYGNLLEKLAKAASTGPEETRAKEHERMMADIANTQMWAGDKLLLGAETFYRAVGKFVGDEGGPRKEGEKLKDDGSNWLSVELAKKAKEKEELKAAQEAKEAEARQKHQAYSDRTMQSPSAQERGYAYPMLDPLLDWWKGGKTEATPAVPGDKTTSLLGTVGLGVGEAIAGKNGLLGWTSGNANAATLPGELTPEQRGESPAATVAKVSGSSSGAGASGYGSGASASVGRGAPKGAAQYMDRVNAAAKKNGLDPALLAGLIEQESRWDPNARSHKGAVGLGQFMPGTAKDMGITDRSDPGQSIDGAAKYLRQNIDAFGGDVSLGLAAYNAGPETVRKAGNRIPNNKETQAYVPGVLARAQKYSGGSAGAVADAGSTASSSGGSVKWQPGVHLGTKSTDGTPAAGGAVKWEPGVHLGTKSTDGGGGAPAAGGDVKWEPGVHLGTKRIDDYNMQLPEGTSAAASARDAPSAVRDMLSSMGGPGGELGRMVGDMRATIDVVQKSDMGEVLSQHSRQFALGGVPQPQHMLAGAKAMMGAAQGLANGFTGAMSRR